MVLQKDYISILQRIKYKEMLPNKLRRPETHYGFHGIKDPGYKYCPRELTLDNYQVTRPRKLTNGLTLDIDQGTRPRKFTK